MNNTIVYKLQPKFLKKVTISTKVKNSLYNSNKEYKNGTDILLVFKKITKRTQKMYRS